MRTVAAALFALLLNGPAFGQEDPVALVNRAVSVCDKRPAGQPRSDCYMLLLEATTKAAEEFARSAGNPEAIKTISATDFKVSRSRMLGVKFKIAGLAMPFAEHALLTSAPADMDPIWLSLSTVPESELRVFYDKCQPQCRVLITGRGSKVIAGVGISVERIEFQ